MLKKKWLVLFILASFLFSFCLQKASAEMEFKAEKFPFKEMQVQVMPEFDYPEDWPKNTPSLLVGQYGTIINKSGQDFNGKIEIPVPAKEKNFQAYLVAEFPDVNKPEVQRPYDVDKEKGLVTWKPKNPLKNNETYRFVIEYYSNSIKVADKKSFTYELKNNAEIKQLDVIFYAPMKAKDIQINPKPQNKEKSEYGEELFYYQHKNVKIGDSIQYSFSYKKDGTESTMAAINKQQAPNDDNHKGVSSGTSTDQVLNNGTSTESTNQKPIIGVGGASIIGIAIILAGAFVFMGLKGKPQREAKGVPKNNQQQSKRTIKNDSKSANAEQKKELRKKLLTGKIDQETYDEQMKKLI
ncbi:hypothetical protein [Neobacillus niacini]|uniref:hypothetical protein n=1 Tax=Neobacillus niacini TaxID=86668 RepID=UPI0028579345|nr:hypothetical protein [Neobacillus niacini]MDR6998705.1 hypothetical protein [Neobacillus niacini]